MHPLKLILCKKANYKATVIPTGTQSGAFGPWLGRMRIAYAEYL